MRRTHSSGSSENWSSLEFKYWSYSKTFSWVQNSNTLDKYTPCTPYNKRQRKMLAVNKFNA